MIISNGTAGSGTSGDCRCVWGDAAQLMCHLDAAEVLVKRLLVAMLEEDGGDRHGC